MYLSNLRPLINSIEMKMPLLYLFIIHFFIYKMKKFMDFTHCE
jgi:hypothetical protein